WSPENGNSLSLAHHLTKWDFALAINSDQSGTTQNRATKLGVRYHSNEWMSAFQYESLKNGTTPASNAYINLFKQDGKSEYGGSLGVYRSDSATELDLNYIALGMKYAIAKNNIIHAGYRVSSAPSDGSQSEKAFGLGFRYSF
ncbi:MAG: hypothetical protein OEL79_06670, partial [Chromatiales bacterium]|nr:hypothetical protein [Chromatiales bacterium]